MINTLRSILLAEDSPQDVELTLAAFQEHNILNQVVVVRDGEEALDYLYCRGSFAARPAGNPALVLLDLKMPKVDGLEALAVIKADEKLRSVPVVMLTSSREECDLVRSYSLGVNAYVVKPVDFQEFVEAVKEIGVFWAVINETPRGTGSVNDKRGAMERAGQKEEDLRVNLRILHLEDDPLDAELVLTTLTDAGMACEIQRVDSEGDFMDAMRSQTFDLIISDFSMPGFDGKAALRLARQHCPEVPFIFVSGTIGEDAAIESLLGGATDYVLKHRFSRLVPAVRRAQREALQRQRSEEALRRSEARYREVFDRNPLPMWVYDVDTKAFLAVNDAAVERYGFSREEFLSMTLADVTISAPQQGPSPAIARAGKHRRKDGSLIDVEISSNNLPFGDRAACLVSISDVTEKKKIESQLLRSQRMDSIGTLAGGIAHDLNNVLAPILMAVQLLRERSGSPRDIQLLETMETSAKRGASIVRQVLTFARGVEGEHIAIQLKHLLASMEKMLGETFPKSIRIEMHVPKNLWTIVGDPTQIDQVLLNLCVNARDAMPHGGVLKISAENTILDEHYTRLNPGAKPGPHIVIDVSDVGQGIPPDVIDKIFEPFFTTKEIGKGTGLGLSTVIAIVKTHGGFVNVYSEIGRGTSFKVFIPARESAETREAGAQLSELPQGNGETILVVDDETAVREIAQLTLETYNYQVRTAKNGAEALAIYAQQRNEIKLVLLDMMMPIMDGPATAHALRAINPDVRIVAASGLMDHAKQAMIANQMGNAVCAVLAKPYTAEKLLSTLHDVLHP